VKTCVALCVAFLYTVCNSSEPAGFFVDPDTLKPALEALPQPAAVQASAIQKTALQPVVAPAPVAPIASVRGSRSEKFGNLLSHPVSLVMRIRNQSPAHNGVVQINHGTGALIDGRIVTALHVVDGPGDILIEINGQWVKCAIVLQDKDIDVAVIEPLVPLDSFAIYNPVDGCHSSVKGTPVRVLDASPLSTLWMKIPGFHHGASGSPIIRDGRLIAVGVAIRSEEEPDYVNIVPAALIEEAFGRKRFARVAGTK
jgi:hypothetical protein